MNDVLDWIVSVNLEPFIKAEYVLMAFFIIGAFTSTENRSNRVRMANLYTLTFVMLAFFVRFLIAYSAQQAGGDPNGKLIYNIVSNDLFRAGFNLIILYALFYRLIKTCCYARARARYMDKLKLLRR